MKQVMAVLLAVLLIMPNLPVKAEDTASAASVLAETVQYNTGSRLRSVVAGHISENNTISDNGTISNNEVASENRDGDAYFQEDGSYTIPIPELNPFFPYEVQFICNGEVSNQWFMSPEDSVEVGGHTFYVSADFDNTVVTQMSLNIAGDTVIVYPEKKDFTDDIAAPASLLPLTEKNLTVDLSAYTPAELTKVSIDSLFQGEKVLESKDKVIWNYADHDDYIISASGDNLNLSYRSYAGGTNWQMIVGEDDQLADGNIRYIIRANTMVSKDWLIPTMYKQDNAGNRIQVSVVNYDYNDYNLTNRRLGIKVLSNELPDNEQAYISLAVNPSIAPVYHEFKIYEGEFTSASEAMAGRDITSQICSQDMTKTEKGYAIEEYQSNWITVVTFDAAGQVTGCLPMMLYLNIRRDSISLNLFEKSDTGNRNYVSSDLATEIMDDCNYSTMTLYQGYAADRSYYLTMEYYKASTDSYAKATAVYLGRYASIKEAVSDNAVEVTKELFLYDYKRAGYLADYSQGVYFTVFMGGDESAEQEIFQYCVKTEEGNKSKQNLNSEAKVSFKGLKKENGAGLDSYVVKSDKDSYLENNYFTIMVGPDVDLSNLAPIFNTSIGAKLYAAGERTPEVSGESLHDFTKGPIQYTVLAEDGIHSKDFWLQVVKASEGAGQLFLNSLVDPNADTRVENGVIYSVRELLLDSYHNYIHDILLANMGSEAISSLSAELTSDVVELDEYWSLKGNYDLSGFTTTDKNSYYGELPNLAKLRIKAKEDVEYGTPVSGVLTLKSEGNTLMVLTLTGIVGDPVITTKEVPQAVKYVPYGTMIENSNKYSWNKVSYSLYNGSLPMGMEIKPNGELYGVPREAGEFTFTVHMNNTNFSSVTKTFTLVIAENTDENVEAATDDGYDLIQRIQTVQLGTVSSNDTLIPGSQTMVSQGGYEEFADIYLDGVKLVKGRDYSSESGSTRITISNQTLANGNASGSHTLGVEFRTQETGTLKCAAQNYEVTSKESPKPDIDDNDDKDNNDDINNGDKDNSDDKDNNGGIDNGDKDNSDDKDNNGGIVDGDKDNSDDKDNNDDINNGDNNSNNSSGDEDYSSDGEEIQSETVTTVTYTIRSGDTLWKIAKKFYGSGVYWQKIYNDNAQILKNPHKISIGQIITIYLNQGTSALSLDGKTYVVKEGDTLWKIAKKLYGNGKKWRLIYQVNQDILADPKRIYAGQVLTIPES